MEVTKRSEQNKTCYMGVTDWRHLSLSLPVAQNETLRLMFCDLRNGIFDNELLSRVEFVGCRLDGTSFRGTRLHEVRFIGCFSSDEGPPTDFRDAFWQDSYATECHLNYTKPSDHEVPGFREWLPSTGSGRGARIVEVANKTLSERNDVRYDGATCLGRLGNPIVAPYLANLLLDPEWEVRVATLRALAQLRDHHFPHYDQALLKWIFLRLGDRHILVRETTQELIETLRPSDETLLFSILGIKGPSKEDKLAALRAVRELLKFDKGYSRLLDLETLHGLLSDESEEVREASLSLLAMLDDPSTLPWILESLSDPAPRIRIEALQAIAWLTEPPSMSHIIHLLSDPNEEVRIETLYILSDAGELQPQHVAQVLADPSPKVLRVARKLLAKIGV